MRDPRVDPIAGDVVIGGFGPRTVLVVNGLTVVSDGGPAHCYKSKVPLQAWRIWAKRKDFISAAELRKETESD